MIKNTKYYVGKATSICVPHEYYDQINRYRMMIKNKNYSQLEEITEKEYLKLKKETNHFLAEVNN